MKLKFLKGLLASLVISISGFANAGIIDSNSVLLDDSGATQLEAWLGQGDLDWDSVWYGTTGATSVSWHAAVDDIGPTFSIYNVTYKGRELLLGGYTDLSWGGIGYGDIRTTANSFLFNLTDDFMLEHTAGRVEIYRNNRFFATFGDGHDLFAGTDVLGKVTGYTYQCGYGLNMCGNTQNNLLGTRYNFSDEERFIVNALETFSISTATNNNFEVPEPSTLAIFALGMIGLASRRFKKNLKYTDSESKLIIDDGMPE